MLITQTVIATESFNLLVFLMAVVYLALRIPRIKKLSFSNKSMHMSPTFRWVFVILFLTVNLIQYALFVVFIIRGHYFDFWKEQLMICVGTTLDGLMLVGGLYLLRLEISKDRKRTHLHMYYTIYLILESLVRVSEEIWIYVDGEQKRFNYGIITTSVITLVVLVILVHKMANNKYEDYLVDIDLPEIWERLRKESVFDLEEESEDDFPYLRVDVVSLNNREISFGVFLRGKPFVIKTANLTELAEFYSKTRVLDIQSKLDLSKSGIQNFLDELLSSWENYQIFVLEFFKVPSERHSEWTTRATKFKEESRIGDELDPNSIYFSLNVVKIAKYNNDFQLLIEVATRSGKHKKAVNKTLKEINDLHEKVEFRVIPTRKSEHRILMPQLPNKKYLVYDFESMEERKLDYEKYLRKVVNDRNVIKRYKEIRALVYSFLGHHESIQLLLRRESSIDYSGLSSRKVRLTTKLNQKKQPTTFYYFRILQREVLLKNIKKTETEFLQLHFQIQRYLHNSQTEKFVEVPVLPRKPPQLIFEAEKQEYHSGLNNYLNQLVSTFPDLSEIYQFKVFLNIKDDEESSFYLAPMGKKMSEFSLERSGPMEDIDELLEVKIDNLGVEEFDMEII